VTTQKAAAGTFDCNVQSRWMGHLLNGILGGTVTPVQQGGTTAYLQTHTLSDPVGKWLTFQAGVPDLGGTVNPYTFVGCQIISAEFTCEVGGPLTLTVETVARDVTEAQTIAAASYPAVNEFHFAQASLKLGTFGAEALTEGIRKVSLKISAPRHEGGPYMGNSGLRSKGVLNDYMDVSGSIETDFDPAVKTAILDKFRDNSATSLVWDFVGPQIQSPYNEQIKFTVPQVFFDGESPSADGPDVVKPSVPWVAQNDGTNAVLTVAYISTDTTL
jgi:hypothetical protein